MNITDTIDAAVAVVGSQKALAELIGSAQTHISGFKKGRPCGYQKHAQIAAVAGLHDLAIRILIKGIADGLNDKMPHEQATKNALMAMLSAFPEEQPTITAAPQSRGATARGVVADKPRLRKSLRT